MRTLLHSFLARPWSSVHIGHYAVNIIIRVVTLHCSNSKDLFDSQYFSDTFSDRFKKLRLSCCIQVGLQSSFKIIVASVHWFVQTQVPNILSKCKA